MDIKVKEKGLSLEEKEYLRQEYLKAFIDYRKNYINDIPKRKILPKDPNFNLYKCRLPFFVRIFTLALDMVHLLEINDPEIITRYQSFHSFVNSIEVRRLSPNIPLYDKDVEEANIFLDYVITKLQK